MHVSGKSHLNLMFSSFCMGHLKTRKAAEKKEQKKVGNPSEDILAHSLCMSSIFSHDLHMSNVSTAKQLLFVWQAKKPPDFQAIFFYDRLLYSKESCYCKYLNRLVAGMQCHVHRKDINMIKQQHLCMLEQFSCNIFLFLAPRRASLRFRFDSCSQQQTRHFIA